VDRTLSDVASAYLVNFATSGDPNEGPRSGLPSWPAYEPAGERVLNLGDSTAPGQVPDKAAFAFFDAVYSQRLGRPLPF
jgi:para-nitrobenzyl esterase